MNLYPNFIIKLSNKLESYKFEDHYNCHNGDKKSFWIFLFEMLGQANEELLVFTFLIKSPKKS